MIRESPPDWLQKVLSLVSNARDREAISGDLLEEYREEQLPRLGSGRATCWYLRQVISVALIRLSGGRLVKQFLQLMCLFAAAAGVWLGVMESILQHPGYAGRMVIDVFIVVQGLATLFFFRLKGSSFYRAGVTAGAIAVALLGGMAVVRILQAPHFEGFVLNDWFALDSARRIDFGGSGTDALSALGLVTQAAYRVRVRDSEKPEQDCATTTLCVVRET